MHAIPLGQGGSRVIGYHGVAAESCDTTGWQPSHAIPWGGSRVMGWQPSHGVAAESWGGSRVMGWQPWQPSHAILQGGSRVMRYYGVAAESCDTTGWQPSHAILRGGSRYAIHGVMIKGDPYEVICTEYEHLYIGQPASGCRT